jgi:S1-C subfamily serine protease
MSAETEPEVKESESKAMAPLRREALLPNERGRGLGTVAVVCTMAGVASGLALATTLMAMQVADSMSIRNCPYRVVQDVQTVELRPEHGFLGIRYGFHDGFADVDNVLPGTPAEAVDLHPGDHILTIDGAAIHSSEEFQAHIFGAHPGSSPAIVFERHGVQATVRPTLIAWPINQQY